VIVRDERADDAPAVRAVIEAAFGQPLEADIVDALRAGCDDRLSLVALDGNRIVGHILFTPATIETADGIVSGYGLAPMAVLPASQRSGVGSALVRAGLERLRASGCPFVIVIGHPEYYPRFGFVRASAHGVRCQWESIPDEAVMLLVLQPSPAGGLGGLAKYRPEFDEAV
jgi:putative acetyltransferase